MWILPQIYFAFSLVAALQLATAESIVRTNQRNLGASQYEETGTAQMVGLSSPTSSPAVSVPNRLRAVLEAFKLLQSIIYNIIERLRDVQNKIDIHITQPIVQFLSSKSDKHRLNDHVDCDIEEIGLPPGKLKMIHEILERGILLNQPLLKRADSTHFTINAHLIYRYLAAADWSKKYNGRSYEDAISDTVEWREQFGINSLDTSDISHLVKNGLGYACGYDKHGRSIVYVKVGRNEKLEDSVTYQKLLMYTVERADRMCVQNGSGEFVAVIDLEGFRWSNSIPIPMIKDAVTLLKKHYPYRLGGVFIINGSPAFSILWSIIKPIMPRKTLAKTFVIAKKLVEHTMCEKLGKEYLEEAYGGTVKEDHGDVSRYFASGYWGK